MRHRRLILGHVALGLLAVILSAGAAQGKKPSLVKVFLNSSPPNANIYIDSKESGLLGQTGAADPLRLPPGPHRVLLELEGYRPFDQQVNLSRGQHLVFKLQPEPAHLDIRPPGTNPNSLGGEIFIDATPAGTVPTKLEISAGKHTVEVRRPGYLVYTEQIEVKTGENRQLLVTIFPEPKTAATTGSLTITAPGPAEITLDNQPRGAAPLLVDNLAPGDHLIEIQPADKGLQPWRRTVRIAAGQQGRVEATFAPVVAAVDPGVPVSVVPRNTKETYVVTLGNAQSCQTPCSLRALPGRQVISVAGPGSKFFRSELSIPNTPTQVTVQHFTLGRSIAGAILLAYGLPSLIASSVAANDAVVAGRTFEAIGYGSLAFSGATSALSAIATLGTIKLNRASVEGLGQVSALSRPRLNLLAAGINPTPDRTGAVAGVSFAY